MQENKSIYKTFLKTGIHVYIYIHPFTKRLTFQIYIYLLFLWAKQKKKQKVYIFLLYRHECFTGKYTTRKIHKNYIRDPSGLFFIISLVSLSMT